jgi:hypothetical protein
MDTKGRISILRVSAQQKVRYQSSCVDPLYWQDNFKSPSFSARVEISSPDKEFIEEIQKAAGLGTISTRKGKKPYYVYMCWNANGVRLIEKLLPYLEHKKRQAEILIKLNSLRGKRGRGGLAPAIVAEMTSLWEEIRKLNAEFKENKIWLK